MGFVPLGESCSRKRRDERRGLPASHHSPCTPMGWDDGYRTFRPSGSPVLTARTATSMGLTLLRPDKPAFPAPAVAAPTTVLITVSTMDFPQLEAGGGGGGGGGGAAYPLGRYKPLSDLTHPPPMSSGFRAAADVTNPNTRDKTTSIPAIFFICIHSHFGIHLSHL